MDEELIESIRKTVCLILTMPKCKKKNLIDPGKDKKLLQGSLK
jgi:hypothetical protein